MIHVSYLNCIIQLRLSLELDINNCQPGMSCFSLGFSTWKQAIVVCTFILFLVAIVFSVPFQLAASDYPFVIFKLFLEYFSMVLSWIIWLINKPCIYCMIILNLQI